MANHKCEMGTELLGEYMGTLEKFKVAEREHIEISLAGTGQATFQNFSSMQDRKPTGTRKP
jgi:hypothetical protein